MKPITNVETLYLQSHGEGVETPILKDVTEYMRQHPSINGKNMAKALNVKRSALSGAIQLLTGENLNDLMKKWRLLHAMYLLRNTSLSYKEVATQCGFFSLRGLTKFLERMIRCTPYEYRKSVTHGNRRGK